MPKNHTTEQFIEKARNIHGDKYDYSKVDYINSRTKITIICTNKDHGIFNQKPNDHLQGRGCPDCGNERQKYLTSKTNEKFIVEANIKHNNKYNYIKTKYKHSKTKVIITCLIEDHGDFEQQPNDHLQGNGCKLCAYDNKNSYKLYKALRGEYEFSGYLYIIKMFNDKESFIKIGISVNPKHRFGTIKSQSKYNIEIIETQLFEDFNQAVIKEHELHEKYKEYSYLPNKKFGGYTECFNEEINQYLQVNRDPNFENNIHSESNVREKLIHNFYF